MPSSGPGALPPSEEPEDWAVLPSAQAANALPPPMVSAARPAPRSTLRREMSPKYGFEEVFPHSPKQALPHL